MSRCSCDASNQPISYWEFFVGQIIFPSVQGTRINSFVLSRSSFCRFCLVVMLLLHASDLFTSSDQVGVWTISKAVFVHCIISKLGSKFLPHAEIIVHQNSVGMMGTGLWTYFDELHVTTERQLGSILGYTSCSPSPKSLRIQNSFEPSKNISISFVIFNAISSSTAAVCQNVFVLRWPSTSMFQVVCTRPLVANIRFCGMVSDRVRPCQKWNAAAAGCTNACVTLPSVLVLKFESLRN